jgi:hypothetical protein
VTDPSRPERDFEKLSKAITEAVVSSPKVKKIVEEILKKDKICAKSFMVLVLKIQALADVLEEGEGGLDHDSEDHVETTDLESQEDQKSEKILPKNPAQQIDGRILSEKEAAFEEFASENFDTEAWLKKLGLIL